MAGKTGTKSKAKTKKGATPSTDVLDVRLVWDKSGSMAGVRDASIEGMKSYISDLQEQETELIAEHGEGVYTYVTLTAFDTVCTRWLSRVPVLEIDLNILNQYRPDGYTAYFDALAKTIGETEAEVEGMKVLCVILTDGRENSSVEYSRRDGGAQRLLELVQSHEAKGNWTFIFLAANIDAVEAGAEIGISSGATAYYTPDSASINHAYASLSNVTRGRRSSHEMASSTPFTDAGVSQDYRTSDKPSDKPSQAPKAPVATLPASESPIKPSSALSDARRAREGK